MTTLIGHMTDRFIPDIRLRNHRDTRLDLIKSIAVMLVLLWHLKPLRVSQAVDSEGHIASIIPSLIDIFYLRVTPVGVPALFIVSLYLFFERIDPSYFQRRLTRLAQVFLFWGVVQFAIYSILCHLIDAGRLSMTLPHVFFLQSIMMGGPPLPLVGDSVFYFLSNLLILTVLSYAYMQLDVRIREPLGVIVVVLFVGYYEFCALHQHYIPYWRLDNFIPYVPIAYFLKFSDGFLKYKYCYLGGFILFVIQEIILGSVKYGYGLSSGIYGRTSVVFGAMAMSAIVLASADKESAIHNLPARFIAVYSLGIYAMHKYWQLLVTAAASRLITQTPVRPLELCHIGIDTVHFISGIVVLIVTMVSAYLAGMTPLKKYVM